MPISSRAIIPHILRQKESFTHSDLVGSVSHDRQEKGSQKKKKSRQGPVLSGKDMARIDETLSILCERGFLVKARKKYTRQNSLMTEGSLAIRGARGDGVVTSPEHGEITVFHEDMAGARNRDTVRVQVREYRKGILSGSITAVVRRERETFFATAVRLTRSHVYLRLMDVQGENEAVAPRDARLFPRGTDRELPSMTYTVKMDDERFCGYPLCTITGAFPSDDEEYDVDRIIGRHSLPGPHGDYPELNDIEKSMNPMELKNRRDYRKDFVVTIDGDNSKDFDDAISLKVKGKRYHLNVHIADVSAHVRKGGPLDNEAGRRGTSIYLGNRVIPMLPEKLSNELCSLREGVDRLTLSVEMIFDRGGNLLEAQYHRGIIRVRHRLTYTGSQAILDTKKPRTLYRELAPMKELADILYRSRIRSGRLDLNIPDEEMVYDDGTIKDIRFATRLDTHRLIEEFMLSANEIVSRVLKEAGVPTLYRIHEEMDGEKLGALNEFLRFLDLRIKKKDVHMSLQEILDMVAGRDYEQVVNLAVLKSMMQAYYGIEPVGHFGLGFADYTHFTSPIRRYPDLVVHRCLKSLIDRSAPPFDPAELTAMGDHSSEMERVAQKAERDLVRLKACRLMKGREGNIYPAVISGVSKYGIYVTLIERPIEGMIPLRTLTDDFYLVQETEHSVVGKRYSRRFTLGDRIQVRLVKADVEMMRIDFELA